MPLKKDLGQWISHFKDSDAPQFEGKSEEERKNMALAAYRAKYGSLDESKEAGYSLNRLADNQIGMDPASDFLAKHNVDLNALAKAKMQGEITAYEIRDVVNGTADKNLIKKFMRSYVTESVKENIDINDPTLARFRAQMAARKKKAAEPRKSINPDYAAVKNASKINALKKKRAQIMIDMEQEAEPEGGPIADRYGDMLNKIDAKIARLQGRKEMDYDTAVGKKGNEYMSKDEIERRAAMIREEDGATAAEEDKFHRDLDKLVHKTFGHSSDEKKEMKEDMTGVDYMKIIDLVKSADNPQNLSVYYNSDHNKVNIGGTGYDKGDLVKMFNLEPGQSSDVKSLFYKANQNAEDVVNAINNEKAGVKAQIKYGYGEEPFVTYKKVNSLDEKAKPDFLDVDEDGDKKEAMKKALMDKAMKKIKEVVVTDDAEKAEDIANKTGEEVKVVKKGSLNEGQHFDYEGKMAQSQLLSIVKNARDLFNMVSEKSQLKSWVQSKLTKAEDYLDAVRTYLEGEALSSTVPAMVENDRVADETGTALSIGDVVKGGDGKIYQIVFSASEGKPSLVPFDLKRRKITTLRNKVYFDDQESSIPKKLNKVMDYSATKGGFMS